MTKKEYREFIEKWMPTNEEREFAIMNSAAKVKKINDIIEGWDFSFEFKQAAVRERESINNFLSVANSMKGE